MHKKNENNEPKCQMKKNIFAYFCIVAFKCEYFSLIFLIFLFINPKLNYEYTTINENIL